VPKKLTEALICIMDPEQSQMLSNLRKANISLFSAVAILWLINLSVMIYKKRIHNKLITGLLYGIIGFIILNRMIEVKFVEPFQMSRIVVITGILATYSKICLGCCQLTAMFEIQAQLKSHIRIF